MIRFSCTAPSIEAPEPTLRRPMSPKRRHHIFTENCTAHNIAPCCICGEPVHRHNDQWIVEHKRALGLLGLDVNSNCGPAHVACALVKTASEDIPRIAKAKRQATAGERPEQKAFRQPKGASFDWRHGRYVVEKNTLDDENPKTHIAVGSAPVL